MIPDPTLMGIALACTQITALIGWWSAARTSRRVDELAASVLSVAQSAKIIAGRAADAERIAQNAYRIATASVPNIRPGDFVTTPDGRRWVVTTESMATEALEVKE
jgi:hypothetical protein